MAETLRREIVRDFRMGHLHPGSPLLQLKGIGEYLYSRLKLVFRRNSARKFTIAQFARCITPFSSVQLRDELQRAMQNNRGNQCTRTTSSPTHHIPDINERGWLAIVVLVRVLAAGRDGHGLGTAFTFNTRLLRVTTRSIASKRCGCRTRSMCTRDRTDTCTWRDGLCQPRNPRELGFPGVAGQTGQLLRMPRNTSPVQRTAILRTARGSVPIRSRDPDVVNDLRSGHAHHSYAKTASPIRLFRRTGAHVRVSN